ncbi:MAG: pilus assembly protein [Chloroflexi bacterium]|nr:pilus assembly protein [Chloroflexota bacterium]
MPVSRLFGALRGQGLLEYALILMLVAIVVFAMITIFGPAVGNIYSNIISNF